MGAGHLAATWSELGKVHIWDLTRPLEAVDDSNVMATYTRTEESPLPVFSFAGHQTEGYAMDWSPTVPGEPVEMLNPFLSSLIPLPSTNQVG